MSTYPEQLVPETVENLHLPSGAHARVPKAEPYFRLWRGEFAGDTYNNKPLLDVDGRPMFAELAILNLFLKEGWDGVWVDTFGKKYRGPPGERKGRCGWTATGWGCSSLSTRGRVRGPVVSTCSAGRTIT